MKRVSLIITFLSFIVNVNAQISLEYTYVGGSSLLVTNNSTMQPLMVDLEIDGYKYIFIDRANKKLDFYDLNHQFWKSISYSNATEINSSGTYEKDILYISQTLFDTDNEIEFMYVDYYYAIGVPASRLTEIVNEDGTILFSESGAPLSKMNIPIQQVPIYNTPNGTKLILSMMSGDANVYSLPGTLSSSIVPNSFKASSFGNPFPNPTSGKITIPYELPADTKNGQILIYDVAGNKIRTYSVGKHFNSISLPTSELSPGNYFYQLKTESGVIGTKKVIVVN